MNKYFSYLQEKATLLEQAINKRSDLEKVLIASVILGSFLALGCVISQYIEEKYIEVPAYEQRK